MERFSLKSIYLTHLAITVTTALGIFLTVPPQLLAYLAGSALSAFNFFLLAQLWKGVLNKKPVASSVIIIVTKYAILGTLLYVFVRHWNLQIIPLLVGLSTIVVSLVVVALKNQKTNV